MERIGTGMGISMGIPSLTYRFDNRCTLTDGRTDGLTYATKTQAEESQVPNAAGAVE